MALDPSIYNQVGKVNLGVGLADQINQFSAQRAANEDRQNSLSQLAQQQQMQGYQMRGLQRAEAAVPEQQAEAKRQAQIKHTQELNLGAAQMLRQGATPDQVIAWGAKESAPRGIDPALTQQHLTQVFQSGKSVEDIASTFEQAAYPEIVAKQRFEKLFSEKVNKVDAPKTREILIGDKKVTQEWNGSKWNEVGRGPAWRDTPSPIMELKMAQQAEDKAKARNQQSLSTQQVLDQSAILYAHPGRKMATGASSFMGSIPGTEARGFKANLDTFKAQTFVPMVSALKGMGALSDAEGKKLSESVGALDPSMPEEEFASSLQSITKYLYDKAKVSGLDVQLPEFAVPRLTGAQPSAHPSDISGLLQKYGR